MDILPKGNNKVFWYVGGGLTLVGVVYEYRKVKKAKTATAAATASAAAAGAATNAATTVDPNSGIDPATGVAYASQTDGFGDTPVQGSPYAALSGLTFDPQTGQYISSNQPAAIANNQQWLQQASAYLTSIGYDQGTVVSALSAYLNPTGTASLSAAQEAIVQVALAAQGNPPTTPAQTNVAPSTGQTHQYDPNDHTILQTSKGIYQVQPGGLWHMSGSEYADALAHNATVELDLNDPALDMAAATSQWIPNNSYTAT